MRKISFLLVVLIIIPLPLISQDVQKKVREVGVSFSSLNNYGIRYRSGNEATLFRLTFLSVNGAPNSCFQNYMSNTINGANLTLSYRIGKKN